MHYSVSETLHEHIALSKGKMTLIFIGALLFTLGSAWLLSRAEIQTSRNVLYVQVMSIAGILFFGLVSIKTAVKLFDSKPGLTIDNDGITDNSSFVSLGLIKWSDIVEIKQQKVRSASFVFIYLENPEKYISTSGGLQRLFISMNNKMYGTPISISSNSLDISMEELYHKLQSSWAKNSL